VATQIFQEIAPGFKSYPADTFEFIVGAASSFDPTTKSVTISTSSGAQTQTYDILVLTTGARTIGEVPWKSSLSGYEHTRDGLHKIQKQVKAAKSIVVGGAGATGVETAAELGFEYGATKKITLITAGKELLTESMPPNMAQGAESQLKKMHVHVVKGVKIMRSTPTGDGKTELSLDNGEKMVTDLYLPTVGVIPNTEYVPKNLLNDKGQVGVDEFLRVKNAQDVWAAGDITDLDFAQIVYADKQATAVAKNLDLVLRGKEPAPYKSGGDREISFRTGPCSAA
jgi:NADH dehydrogenase FAD-containing subunit